MFIPPVTAVILSNVRDLFLIVFLALGSVWFALDIIRRLRKEPVAPTIAPPAPVPAPVPAPAVVTTPPVAIKPTPVTSATGIPPEHLAVIAATVHHLFRGRGRLAGVTRATGPDSRWAHEGRRDIFTSHRIR